MTKYIAAFGIFGIISFGNLGLTIGTTLSGWGIAQAGIACTPWASLALVLGAWRVVLLRTRTRTGYQVSCS